MLAEEGTFTDFRLSWAALRLRTILTSPIKASGAWCMSRALAGGY